MGRSPQNESSSHEVSPFMGLPWRAWLKAWGGQEARRLDVIPATSPLTWQPDERGPHPLLV